VPIAFFSHFEDFFREAPEQKFGFFKFLYHIFEIKKIKSWTRGVRETFFASKSQWIFNQTRRIQKSINHKQKYWETHQQQTSSKPNSNGFFVELLDLNEKAANNCSNEKPKQNIKYHKKTEQNYQEILNMCKYRINKIKWNERNNFSCLTVVCLFSEKNELNVWFLKTVFLSKIWAKFQKSKNAEYFEIWCWVFLAQKIWNPPDP
jgi:hypothetical protein